MPVQASPVTRFERLRGPIAVLLVVAGAVLIGIVGVAPVQSQLPTLQAAFTSDEVPADDAWADIWNQAPSQDVPLSAQNLIVPFGGGSVQAVTVKALFDDDRVYLNMEWSDPQPDHAVNGSDLFSDAAALQFPTVSGAATPYTMGSADQPVNIWQWKAVWQRDIEQGFAVSNTRYPDTYVDDYPGGEDTLYLPALDVGNPLSQRAHTSPIENLIAGGFGTLTTSVIQDVEGSGEWRDGTWKVVFARSLSVEADDLASFGRDETTQMAFAVWDGATGDRNGQKSIAQFIDLRLGGVEPSTPGVALPPPESNGGVRWVPLVVLMVAILPVAAMFAYFIHEGRDKSQPRKP